MEIRPRWSRDLTVEKESIMTQFKSNLESDEEVVASVWDHHIILKIPHEKQHFWSPQLTVSFEEMEDGKTRVRGLCGPRPTVWMMFVFFYFILGFTGTMVMIMGFSQMNLGLSAGILWLLPAIGFLILMVYLSAKAGQKMARAEMETLYDFCRDIITPIEQNTPTLPSEQSPTA